MPPTLAALISTMVPAGAQREPVRIQGTEQIEVNLVLIDVVVRDRKDRQVSGLLRDDFELLVDRLPVEPSAIESFEEICHPLQEPDSDPAVEAPATPPAPAAARYLVLYFDFSQLTLGGRRQALHAASQYLASGITDSDRVMILAHKKGLRLVQDFTSDGAALAARIDELIQDTETIDTDVLEEAQNIADVGRRLKYSAPVQRTVASSERTAASVYATQEDLRARRSFESIEKLMPSLAGIRGRKALVLFTDALREEPGVQYFALTGYTPSEFGLDNRTRMQRLTQEANAAGVSFYTVHASGLDDAPASLFGDSAVESPAFGEAARTGVDSALSLQTTLAAETGGRALQRTNDVAGILHSARSDLACYYLIGYQAPARGDNQRHSLIVQIGPDHDGNPRRGLSVRHRPYYIDTSPEERRERLVRSALDVPQLYGKLPVSNEAFALAPTPAGNRILVKADLPLDRLSLVPSGNEWLEGHAVISGEVSTDEDVLCEFEHEVPVRVPRKGDRPTRLVFETGCVLKPGSYNLSIAVMDPVTSDIGAQRTPLLVPDSGGEEPYISDVHLWARDREALLVTAGAAAIGLKDTSSDAGFVPMAVRRLEPYQEALLSFLACPRSSSSPQPITVERALQGDQDKEVAQFRELHISEPPDPETGCYQIVSTIPSETLGEGFYIFRLQVSGSSFDPPVSREVVFSVE